MTLLVITQKVDAADPILGFFHRWLEKFAEKTDKLYVIANSVGPAPVPTLRSGRYGASQYHLPDNVEVFSLGKEKGYGRLRRVLRFFGFLVFRLQKCNGIFVHMCPEYAIAAAPLAKFFKKKMLLWYVHKSCNWKLRLAEKLTDKIFTASAESCRLKSSKVEITGHGIDVDFFNPDPSKTTGLKFKILSVGRISPIKNYETLIRATDILVNQKQESNIEIQIVGDAYLDSDLRYKEKIIKMIDEMKSGEYIKMIGSLGQKELVRYYQGADLLINLCPTGGLDKVALEAASCGLPVLVSNQSFASFLRKYQNKLLFLHQNTDDLVQKIMDIKNLQNERREIGSFLRQQVISQHNLNNLIEKIINFFVQ